MIDKSLNQHYIYGVLAFIKEYTSGMAFHYYSNGIQREFQLEIRNSDLRSIK